MSISPLNTGMTHAMPSYDAPQTRSRAAEGAATATSASASEVPTPAPDAAEVRQALDEIEKVVAPMAQALEFSIDDDSGKTVVKVMDTETDEVIRQMPSEEVLAISKALDKLKGLLLRQQA